MIIGAEPVLNSVVFGAAVFLLAAAFRFADGHWVNPFSVFAVPLAAVAVMVNTVGQLWGYVAVTESALRFMILGFAAYWLGGFLPTFLLGPVRAKRRYSVGATQSPEIVSAWRLWTVVLLALAASAYLYGTAFLTVGTAAFGTEAIAGIVGRGPMAHVRLLSYPALLLSAVRYMEAGRRRWLLASILLWLSQFGIGVKYHAILPLVTVGYLLWIRGSRSLVRYALIGGVMIPTAFVTSYALHFAYGGSPLDLATFWWSIQHMTDYIAAGPIGLGAYMSQLPPGAAAVNHSWFQRLLLVSVPDPIAGLFGASIPGEISQWYVTIRDTATANVGTLLWRLYGVVGIEGAAMWLLSAGALLSVLRLGSRLGHVAFETLTAHTMALMTLGVFGHYFHLLPVLEYGLWTLLVSVYCSRAGVRAESTSRVGGRAARQGTIA